MNTLLKLATGAHGGVGRWNQLESLKAHLSVTGAIWHVKGRPDVLKDIRIELPLHEERLTTHFVGQNKRFIFTPHQVAVEDEQGHLIENRHDPRRAFEGRRVGGEVLSEALGVLALGGSLTTLGYAAGRKATIDVTNLIWRRASIKSFSLFGQPQAAWTDTWNAIVPLLHSGAIKADRG